MKYSALASLLLPFLLFAGPASAQDSPDSVVRGTKQFQKKVVASGLAGPWEVTWGPDGMLWVTERFGKRVTRIDPATGKQNVAVTIGEVSAPGGQDGLLGMALHPEMLQGTGQDYVYVAYTYVDKDEKPDENFEPESPYRYLYLKIARFTYNPADGTLSGREDVITGLPAGNDHVAGRLKVGPDKKLYLTIGDQGHNQLANFCLPIESQRLPTQKELDDEDYASYVGKSLRLNLDGSAPKDNPRLDGVVSHVYTYGHRNPQGLDFGPDGTLYSTEHGPKSDDEVNVLKAGSNYGWPHVAGMRDDKAYEYGRWAESSRPCAELTYNDFALPPSVPRDHESAFTKPIKEPIATMFTVPNGFNFQDPACKGVDFICWPTVGVSSIEYYRAKGEGIPGWETVLLATTLKRGSLYVVPLSADRQTVAGHLQRYFQAENRLRDTAISPDGKTIYLAVDADGLVEGRGSPMTTTMENPGAILAYTHQGEGDPAASAEPPPRITQADPGSGKPRTAAKPGDRIVSGKPPRFTAQQAVDGKASYDSHCAVCHGSSLTNGTFGPPLAGQYFKDKWFGRTVGGLNKHARTMPPTAPASLPDDTYASIVAYVLQMNGFEAGATQLSAGSDELDEMAIQ